MWLRRGCLLAGLVAALAAVPAPAVARSHHRSSAKPRAFHSCAGLVGYARRHFAVTHGVPEPAVAPVVEPTAQTAPQPGAETTNAPSAGTSFSTTNNQEEGVDEPDIVKTDGHTIFALSGGRLHAVAIDAAGPKLVGSLSFDQPVYAGQLLLRGHRLIVISGGAPVPVPLGVGGGGPVQPAIASLPVSAQTVIREVDVRDHSAMRLARTVTVDGNFVDARQNGSTARLVINSAPRAVLDSGVRAAARGWVPRLRFQSAITHRRHTRAIARCAAVRRPVEFSGLGMLTILTIDLDRGLLAVDSDPLMADAQVVYGSPRSLYVATQKWIDPITRPDQLPAGEATVIDRFDASDPDTTRLVSSGEVPGYVLNQFSLSELDGHLRVATTSRPIWWTGGLPRTPSQSTVTVLDDRNGALVPVGRVTGLGTGEQIYSVRFLGDTGYVVTFRQIDPLFVIDLSRPAAPRVAGKLELRGYSAYLHPVGDGLLLGIGVDVAPSANEPSGTQIELFDVADPNAPRLLDRKSLGGGSSTEVQYDHHAFLFWPPARLAVLPLQLGATSGQGFTGAIGYRLDPSGIAEVGRVTHDPQGGFSPPIRRSVVVGDRLFTVSDAGVMASSLSTLARQAFVAFPGS